MSGSRQRSGLRTIPIFATVALLLGALGLPAAQAALPPAVTGFSPACADVGVSVYIGGSHFQGATLVEFGGVSAPDYAVNSSNLITATVPTGAATGPISVTTPVDSADSTDYFTVSADCAPTISSFSPASGPVGTNVVITGSKFVGATLVEFGGVDQTSLTWSPEGTQITAAVPTGAVDGKIAVTTPDGTATSASSFDVTPPPPGPTITSFSPTSGPVGTSVVIRGTNLTGATEVTFNGTAATSFTVNSATQITAVVPTGATTGPIGVTTPGGTAASPSNFTVLSTAPTITSFVPISGPVGTTVVITGTNLTGATGVTFRRTAATSFEVNSATQITAVVPVGATSGTISVTTPNGTAASATSFTVTAAGSPTITSFSPTSGRIGSSVVITGTNFTGTTSVEFNAVAADFTVNSSTRITAVVPADATTGPITATNPNGTGTSATDFTVIGAPTITSFDPTSGTEGTPVTITGTDFTGATEVDFLETPATSFTVDSATQITTAVPIGAASGPITVVTPFGTGTSADDFTVEATVHSRAVSLGLARHLVARGYVTAADGFSACYAGVTVMIRHRVSGVWRTIDSTFTDATGFYRVRIADKPGAYRAKAPKLVIDNDVCARAISPVAHN